MIVQHCPIVIVDDDAANVNMLKLLLSKSGFTSVHGTTDPLEVEKMVEELQPYLIMMDLHMPGLHGRELLRRLLELDVKPSVPVVVVTGDTTIDSRRDALRQGARDFVSKPFDLVEIVARINNLIQARILEKRLLLTNETLEQLVAERTRELENTQMEVLSRLSRAAELRDDDTGLHVNRVSEYAASLAFEFGLPAERCEMIRRTAPLHDIGKIGIPDSILLKPGKLDQDEWVVMKSHSAVGAGILEGSSSELVVMAESIALSHHERWDGRGYPHGLAGEAIPIEARIVTVCDVFDALTSARPYKQPWPVAKAVQEIEACAGTQFDPELVACFLRVLPEIVQIREGLLQAPVSPGDYARVAHIPVPSPPSP